MSGRPMPDRPLGDRRFSRGSLLLPLAVLVGAAVVDGAIASGGSVVGLSWTAWPIVGGLAALVILTLATQVKAVAEIEPTEHGARFATVNGQTMVVAVGLMVVGLALLMGSCAPDLKAQATGVPFTTWAGFATLGMGLVLTIARTAVGRPKHVALMVPADMVSLDSEPPARDARDRRRPIG